MKISLSNCAIVLVLLACLAIDLHLKKWEKQDRVIEDDVHWYYGYLAAKFIYNDIKLVKSDYHFGKNYYYFWTVTTVDGKKVIKSTMGLAVLYAPFFFVAHGFALLFHYPATGFSEPYKIFLLLSALFYLFIGLDVLKKILAHYGFTDKISSLTILLTGMGTNLLCYSSLLAPMPHVYNFCLFALFFWFTIKWHQNQSIKNTFLIGLVFGLITLIRPSNALVIFLFALYGVTNLNELKQRFVLFRKESFLLNILFGIAILWWIPQFCYWKKVSGSYFLDSYPGENFFFKNPHILNGLFSIRKGWLVYTPMMGFALLGIVVLKNELKKLQIPLILFMAANIYVIFSWWCWWYGGTFGQRSLIESYAFLAIPFASFIKLATNKKGFYSILFYGAALFFIWLNVFQTFQKKNESLHWDGMTKELYVKQFGKLARIPDFDKYVSNPDYEEAIKGKSCEPVTFDSNPVKALSSPDNKDEKAIFLKAANGNYLSADDLSRHHLFASNASAIHSSEFILHRFGKNECSLRASDGHFLCAELKQHAEITYSRDYVGAWETFVIVPLDAQNLALKAANGKYLTIDGTTGQLFARSDVIGKNETFVLIPE